MLSNHKTINGANISNGIYQVIFNSNLVFLHLKKRTIQKKAFVHRIRSIPFDMWKIASAKNTISSFSSSMGGGNSMQFYFHIIYFLANKQITHDLRKIYKIKYISSIYIFVNRKDILLLLLFGYIIVCGCVFLFLYFYFNYIQMHSINFLYLLHSHLLFDIIKCSICYLYLYLSLSLALCISFSLR